MGTYICVGTTYNGTGPNPYEAALEAMAIALNLPYHKCTGDLPETCC